MLQQPEDEEFVVHKAGPQLPLRRPKIAHPTQFSHQHVVSSDDYSKHSRTCPLNSPRNVGSLANVNLPSFPSPLAPQVISSVGAVTKITSGPLPVSRIPTKSPRTISPDRKKTQADSPRSHPEHATPSTTPRRSPSPSFTSTPVRSRSQTPSFQVESKVKQYIQQVKRFDEEQRAEHRKSFRTVSGRCTSLEDLYQVPTSQEIMQSEEATSIPVQEKLRESLRIIKEKEEMISKLRQSCHELKIKWADAQNRIDELRFGMCHHDNGNVGRRSSFSTMMESPVKQFSSESGGNKRSASAMSLKQMQSTQATNTEPNLILRSDKATETDQDKRRGRTRVKANMSSADTSSKSQVITEQDDIQHEEVTSQESNFDPVLEEKCSNWLEKIQNWKTDPSHQQPCCLETAKDKDSCGDKDSGFRGSAEIDLAVVSKNRTKKRDPLQKVNDTLDEEEGSTTKVKSVKLTDAKKLKMKKSDTQSTDQRREEMPDEGDVPNFSSLSITTMVAHFDHMQKCPKGGLSLTNTGTGLGPNASTSTEESGPASLQIAQPWHTFSRIPCSASEYEGFPSYSSSRLDDKQSSYNSHVNRAHVTRSLSVDRLHKSGTGDPYSQHRELLSRLDKKFQALHPLLDSVTQTALSAQSKSEKLAKSLATANSRRRNSLNVYATDL